MAFPRIEIYARARPLTGDEDVVVSQGGVLRKASTNQIKTFVGTSGGSVVANDLGLVRWDGAVDPSVGYGTLVAINGLNGVLIPADKLLISGALGCLGVYELDSTSTPCIRSSA